MAEIFDVGDVCRTAVVFRDAANQVADPTTVSFKFRTPSGVETTWSVTPGQIVKDSTGTYHADVPITEKGVWTCKFIGTGAVQTIEEGTVVVKSSLIE
jgi:uncharacterized protein YfaS (alpha-2-macroglobulin family)